jgi:hypothetical protein
MNTLHLISTSVWHRIGLTVEYEDVAPCSLVEIDRRLRDAYCLHHQGDESADDGGSKHP